MSNLEFRARIIDGQIAKLPVKDQQKISACVSDLVVAAVKHGTDHATMAVTALYVKIAAAREREIGSGATDGSLIREEMEAMALKNKEVPKELALPWETRMRINGCIYKLNQVLDEFDPGIGILALRTVLENSAKQDVSFKELGAMI